jgi:hypothetical protein
VSSFTLPLFFKLNIEINSPAETLRYLDPPNETDVALLVDFGQLKSENVLHDEQNTKDSGLLLELTEVIAIYFSIISTRHINNRARQRLK